MVIFLVLSACLIQRPCNALIKFLPVVVIKVCTISDNVIFALFIAMLYLPLCLSSLLQCHICHIFCKYGEFMDALFSIVRW